MNKDDLLVIPYMLPQLPRGSLQLLWQQLFTGTTKLCSATFALLDEAHLESPSL